MNVHFGIENLKDAQGGVLSIGNFDGIHCGHRLMLKTLVEKAQSANAPSVVLTFDPSPLSLLFPEKAPPKLTSRERKIKLIQNANVDHLVLFPTTREFLALSPEQFFEQIVIQKIHAQGMVEGPNFFFGHKREGDVNRLQQLCNANSVDLSIVKTVLANDEFVSSTRIRNLIQEGKIKAATELLGEPYQIEGTVVAGAARGREIGFPTANLEGIETILPAAGVYAGTTSVGNTKYTAAIHIGGNPTFGDAKLKVEAHLIGFQSEIYGEQLSVSLIKKIRDVQTFANVEELKSQLAKDIESAKQVLHFS